jgi:ABC-type nitrate/sulfonate/bicarbonate transport system permease component
MNRLALAKAGALVLVLLVWQLAALRGLPGYVLGPLEILKHFAKAFGSAELYEHIWASLARSLAGFALGSFLGKVSGTAKRAS